MPTLAMPRNLLATTVFQPLELGAGGSRRDADPAVAAFALLAAGEREALGEIYELFADEIFGFALWLTGSRVEAADVVQEVFVRLLERTGRISLVTHPRAYLLRVVRTVAIDRHRRSRPTEELEVGLLVADTRDPVRDLDAERISRWLRRLPPKQRGALFLRYFSDLTYAEIGKVMRIPAFTAASRCRLATGRLRRWLESGGP